MSMKNKIDKEIEIDMAGYAEQLKQKLAEAATRLSNHDYTGSWTSASARITNLYKDPASMTLTVTYTDGTNQIIDLISNPGAGGLQVGMTKVEAVKLLTGALSGTQSSDPLHAHVEAAGIKPQWQDIYLKQDVDDALSSRTHPVDLSSKLTASLDPRVFIDSQLGGTIIIDQAAWADPLKAKIDKANNTVACVEPLDPTADPLSSPHIYYHDRFPSIPIRSIIDDAITMLNNKKKLHISKISSSQTHPDFTLAISADHPTDPGLRKVLEVTFTDKTFDRAHHTDIDKYAGLKAKLDTNTYIKLRIAFLLYHALKLRKSDAKNINLDIFRIISSDTRPNFHI